MKHKNLGKYTKYTSFHGWFWVMELCCFFSQLPKKTSRNEGHIPPPRSHAGGISRRTGAIFGHSCHRGVVTDVAMGPGVVHFFGVLGCCFFVDLPSGNLT